MASTHSRGGGSAVHGSGKTDDEVQPIKITNRRMLAWFYRNLAPHWHKIVVAIIAMVLSTGAALYGPLIIKDIIDKVVIPKNLTPLMGLSVMYLIVLIVAQVFSAVRTVVMHLLGQRFVYTVRMQCYQHLMTLGLDYFERERSGDIMSRISNDVSAVESMVVHGTDNIISNGFHVVAAVGVLFVIDWRAALIALAPVPIFVSCLWVFAHYVRPVFKEIRKELGEINVKLQERISGIRVIKAFARENPEIEYFDKSNRAYWKASAKSTWMWGTFFPALSLVTSAGLAVLVWYCGWKAALGAMTVGMLYVYHRYMQRFYRPIGSLAHMQNMLNQALASVARIFELLDEKPGVEDEKDAVELGRVNGQVDIKGVSFKYETGEMILQDVSVSAAPGEVVAIVGRSGAGKTSLVNLIPRFYDPCKGRVMIDGHDLRKVTQESLRRNIGMVLQETFLFNATVKENIRYARPDASEQEIIEAAKGAHAHEFVSQLQDGYDTVIGERGVRLSGGEKQRIAIARAFLVDPRILILDEATSMVDTEAEQIIQEALANLMKSRTVFIIAHRLSTVRSADKIVVIDQGQVIEQDRHDKLMAKNGLYKEMIMRQFQLDEEWSETDGMTPDMLE